MVKNEQDNIVPTLKPFISAGIKNFLVYDTGSNDNTIPNVKSFFNKYKCRGVIVNDPFIDFASSRDKCLDAGDEKFKDCKFMLMIDAEWYIENPQGLVDFCVQYKDDNLSVYDITVTNGVSKFSHTRLIRIGGDAFFKDVVHEYMERSKIINIPSTTYLSYRPKANSTERWYRDLSLLLRKYQQSKTFVPKTTPYIWDNNKGKRYNLLLKSEHEKPAGIEPRTVFYLGQTYDCLNIKNEAIKYYLERSEMGGYIEEAFMALYRVGKLYEDDDWDKASKYYLAAYEKFPSRIEPLVKLAQHCSNPQIKYMYAKQACITPQPDHGLFLETGLYEYDRWDQLAIGAWYMPFYKEGYDAVQKALKIKQLPHLLRNKELFEGALGIKKNDINNSLNDKLTPNNDNEQKNNDNLDSKITIIATMTTIPSRIKYIEPVIKSVLSQTVNIKHLEINIPMFCKRTNEEYIIPEWLQNYDKVKIFRTEDYGAITKVAPTLLRYQMIDDVYLWCIDDDFEYQPNQLSLVMIPFNKSSKQILARYGGELTSQGEIKAWTGGPAEVSYYEGFGSVLYPPNCIKENFLKYLELTSNNDNCRRADDIVLSMYFKHIGVQMIFHNRPDNNNPYILPGKLAQSNTDALSANGHQENYKIVYKYIKSILNDI